MDTAAERIEELRDARARTLALVDDLDEDAFVVPFSPIVNPPLWELGHVAWFWEYWTLRHLGGREPLRADGDRLYDSAAVHHDTRWQLEIPDRRATLAYMHGVLDLVREALETGACGEREDYFHRLATYHEDMHGEALVYTRQTLGHPPPQRAARPSGSLPSSGPCSGDVEIPGGTFELGAARPAPFAFDNEKWAHALEVSPFKIARAPVTQAQFAEFVAAGGYEREAWWSKAGWQWRVAHAAQHPLHWRRDDGGRFVRMHFDTAVPLEPDRPVVHVSWYEAEAWCAFANRRLPTEIEWEAAAAGEPGANGRLSPTKRLFPWGNSAPTPERAHLDLHFDGVCDVGAHASGDSAFGCRQMIGNVWEWTASDFAPYPGFVVDPYKEYSAPWFETHKVLRGGAFATRSRLIRNTWRNFYTPDRRDVLAGFRTCAR